MPASFITLTENHGEASWGHEVHFLLTPSHVSEGPLKIRGPSHTLSPTGLAATAVNAPESCSAGVDFRLESSPGESEDLELRCECPHSSHLCSPQSTDSCPSPAQEELFLPGDLSSTALHSSREISVRGRSLFG